MGEATTYHCIRVPMTAEPDDERMAAWQEALAARFGDAFGGLAWQRERGLQAWVRSTHNPEAAMTLVGTTVGDAAEGSPAAENAGSAEDWFRAWHDTFEPVEVAGFRVVATWMATAGRRPAAGAGPAEIVIEPRLAFGTGRHETTRLALRAMAALWEGRRAAFAARPPRVLDIGSGSAILAIAAWQLGAAVPVVATEIDADCLENARHNIAVNTGDPGSIDFRIAPDLSGLNSPEHCEVVVCNMLSHQFAPLLGDLVALLAPAGALLLSGFLAEEQDRVSALTRAAGLGEDEGGRLRENDWVCGRYHRAVP